MVKEELVEECRRCGACCVYFHIAVCNNGIFKKSGEACNFLRYDSEKKQASCTIHEGVRPEVCKDYFCGNSNERVREGLKRFADNIEAYVKA